MKITKIIIICFILFTNIINGENIKLFNFANFLFEEGDYYRAIGEYKRYIFENPDGKFLKKARYNIGLCYLRAEKWEKAEAIFNELENIFEKKEKECVLLSQALLYMDKKDYTYSNFVLEKYSALYSNSKIFENAFYLKGWNFIYIKNWIKAKDEFSKIKINKELKDSSDEILKNLENSDKIDHRSNLLSGLFSTVLPGAGYIYCGRWSDGLISMLINGIFIYNAFMAFKNNDTVGKFIYGIPTITFYTSNIYGSVVAANKYNEDEVNKYISSLEAFKINLKFDF